MSLRRADHSSRGVLTDCGASLCVIQNRREWGGHGPLGAVAPKANKQTIHNEFKPSSPTNYFFSQVNCRSKVINGAEWKTRRGFSFFTCRMKFLREKVKYIVIWQWLNLNTVSTLTLPMIFEEVNQEASIHQVFQPQSSMNLRYLFVSQSFYKIYPSRHFYLIFQN